jgi:hypothetical protein
MLNSASLTLSVVGRVPVPGTAFNGLPLALPDTTLTLKLTYFLYVFITQDFTKFDSIRSKVQYIDEQNHFDLYIVD